MFQRPAQASGEFGFSSNARALASVRLLDFLAVRVDACHLHPGLSQSRVQLQRLLQERLLHRMHIGWLHVAGAHRLHA